MKSRINFETLLFGILGIFLAGAFSSYFGLGFAASAPVSSTGTPRLAASAPAADLTSAHPTAATSHGNNALLPGSLTAADAGTINSATSTNKPSNSEEWSNNIPSPPVGTPLSSYNKLLAPKPPVPFSS